MKIKVPPSSIVAVWCIRRSSHAQESAHRYKGVMSIWKSAFGWKVSKNKQLLGHLG